MEKLVRLHRYSREEIHDIFAPETPFSVGSGYWGIQGILKVPDSPNDYIFLVTYGQKQGEHEFKEGIDENGILTWQSQPSQDFETPQIKEFINHDYRKNSIHLFLRKNKKGAYYYMGKLAYVTHDNVRENPVHFKWQIIDWEDIKYAYAEIFEESGIAIEPVYDAEGKGIKLIPKPSPAKFEPHKYKVAENKVKAKYIATEKTRKGKKTDDFYRNVNVDFPVKNEKNTDLGNKGEDVVVAIEKKWLEENGRVDLAEKVKTTRELHSNTERFDVLSYDLDGKEIYIEVKTTKGGQSTPFYISRNEVDFSHEHASQYKLYRLYNFNEPKMSAEVQIVEGAIEKEKLEPTNYVCRIGEDDESI